MKVALTPSVTFSPGTGQITLGIPNFDIRRLYAIINVTSGNTLVYAPGGGSSLGYASLTGSTLTLQANVSAMNASDSFLVIYDQVGQQAAAASQSITIAPEHLGFDEGALRIKSHALEDILVRLLNEIRLTNTLLVEGFTLNLDLDGLRDDVALDS